ncbi:MAG: hypothetical protein WAV38_05620 [Xanthobacteraceae bacterium]
MSERVEAPLTDQIVDVNAATRRGIQVTNVPNEWCAEEVATIGPRAVLMRMAGGFIRRSVTRLKRWRVSGVSGA